MLFFLIGLARTVKDIKQFLALKPVLLCQKVDETFEIKPHIQGTSEEKRSNHFLPPQSLRVEKSHSGMEEGLALLCGGW